MNSYFHGRIIEWDRQLISLYMNILHLVIMKTSYLLRSSAQCVFCWNSDLISHTQRHTLHTGANRLTHPYKYISTPPVICMRTAAICIYIKNLQSLTVSLLFKNYSLADATYLLTRFNKTKLFPRNTRNTDRDVVIK